MDILTAIGRVAAFCTTVSYFPQLRTGHTGDLSLLMFLVLAAAVALWILYGILKSDVIVLTTASLTRVQSA